jgi:hypothetical protein
MYAAIHPKPPCFTTKEGGRSFKSEPQLNVAVDQGSQRVVGGNQATGVVVESESRPRPNLSELMAARAARFLVAPLDP